MSFLLCGLHSSPRRSSGIFSLVHFCSVHFFSQDGRGHWQKMWLGVCCGAGAGVGHSGPSWQPWWTAGLWVAMIAAHREERGGGERLSSDKAPPPQPAHHHPLSTTFPQSSGHCAAWLSVISDVDVSDVCRGTGQVHILIHAFGFCSAAVLLSLPQAGLQQRLDLLLTCPQAVLQTQNQHWVNTITLLTSRAINPHMGLGECVCIPGHCEWPVTGSWWGSGRTRRHLDFSGRDLEQLPPRCLQPPWTEDWLWSWHLWKPHKHKLQHKICTVYYKKKSTFLYYKPITIIHYTLQVPNMCSFL